MMTAQELLDGMDQFYGTEAYHRVMPGFVLTDGAKFLADNAGAYWLMVTIVSYGPRLPRDEGFVLAVLKVKDKQAHFSLQDDEPPNTIYAQQDIEYTDFPLDEIKLYVCRGEVGWVIMLPSEY